MTNMVRLWGDPYPSGVHTLYGCTYIWVWWASLDMSEVQASTTEIEVITQEKSHNPAPTTTKCQN